MQFLQRLRRIPLANSAQMGRFSSRGYCRRQDSCPAVRKSLSVSPAQIEAAFRDTNADELAATAQAISDSILLAKRYRQLCDGYGRRQARSGYGCLGGRVSGNREMPRPLLAKDLCADIDRKPGLNFAWFDGRGGSEGGAIRSRQDVTFARSSVFANTTRALSRRVLCHCFCVGRSDLWR